MIIPGIPLNHHLLELVYLLVCSDELASPVQHHIPVNTTRQTSIIPDELGQRDTVDLYDIAVSHRDYGIVSSDSYHNNMTQIATPRHRQTAHFGQSQGL